MLINLRMTYVYTRNTHTSIHTRTIRDIYRDIVSILLTWDPDMKCVRFVAFLNLAGTESKPTFAQATHAHTHTHTHTQSYWHTVTVAPGAARTPSLIRFW